MRLLPPIATFTLTLFLAACGGQYDIDTPVRTAAASASLVAPAASATHAMSALPAPDCAAEGCASLRIIDGNAEAWRIDAGRRAAREAVLPQS